MDVETYVAEDIASLVEALATHADPAGRCTIKAAFREGLVDESMTSKENSPKAYAEATNGSPTRKAIVNWLDNYRMDYEEIGGDRTFAAATQKCRGPNIDIKIDTTRESRRPDIPATVPIRNAQAKLGRNDPCWCGSGKKFKKCHLGKDGGDR